MDFLRTNPEAAFCAGVLSVFVVPPVVKVFKLVGKNLYWSIISPIGMKQVAAKKRKQLQEQLDLVKVYVKDLSEAKRAVIAKAETIPEILALQQQGQTTAEEILKFYWTNALDAHGKTNCLVALDVTGAISAAKAADAATAKKTQLGPLHGIPVSLKECIATKGMDSTIGVSAYCFDKDPAFNKDSPLAAQIRAAGAVIVGKTNVPQTMLSFECYNAVFGNSTNPYSRKHTTGGSSGGEGALLALRGAVVGIGTDIGGSIRIPAHFCGIYGLKPTQWRLSVRGFRSPVKGQEGVPGVAGPMASRLENVEYMFKVLTNGRPWEKDGNLLNVPFRTEQRDDGAGKKLNVGWYVDDGILEASPACQRAVRMAIAALEKQGHKVIPLGSVDNVDTMRAFYQCIAADGAESVSKAIKGDPASPHVRSAMNIALLPHNATIALAKLVGTLGGDKMFTSMVRLFNKLTVYDYYQLMHRRNEARTRFHELFAKGNLDIIIAPGLATPAPKLGSTTKYTFGCAFTACLNLCDVSVVTVPVTAVDPSQDQWTEEQLLRKKQRGNKLFQKEMNKIYNPTEMAGLPVGVQVVGPRLSEEFVLGVAAQLDAALKTEK